MAQAAPVQDIAQTRGAAEWWPHVMLGIASALLLTLLVVTLYYANTARRLLTDLQEYAWQVDKVDALLIQLLNAETGARGFLASGDNDYLEPYRDAVAQMGILLSDIDVQPGKPELEVSEYARLKTLINDELAALSAAIDAAQSHRGRPDLLMDRGNRTMDNIRASLSRLRARLDTDSATSFVNSLSFLGNSRWVVISLFSGAFILLLGLFALMQKQVSLRRGIAAIMNSENERLERLVARRTLELNNLATYLTRISEAEKRRIAQELHDEMGALLTAARMDSIWILRELDPALKEKYGRRLHRLTDSLDAAISLKRKITTDLKPPLLQELGLVDALRAMAEDLAADGAQEVRVDLPETLPALDEEKTLAVFRIIQESLTNIRKYADAGHVEVSMQVREGDIHVRIADDGRGFDNDSVRPGSHGISGMRHRAQMFGGNLQVVSTPGEGTVITARIPLQDAPPLTDSVLQRVALGLYIVDQVIQLVGFVEEAVHTQAFAAPPQDTRAVIGEYHRARIGEYLLWFLRSALRKPMPLPPASSRSMISQVPAGRTSASLRPASCSSASPPPRRRRRWTERRPASPRNSGESSRISTSSTFFFGRIHVTPPAPYPGPRSTEGRASPRMPPVRHYCKAPSCPSRANDRC